MITIPLLRRTLLTAVAAGLAIAGTAVPAQAADDDILTQLKAVNGLTVISESSSPPAGYRYFILSYKQHSDHRDPGSSTFEQRFQLLHKSTGRPMVLHTTGYNMPANPFRSEVTRIVDGNQISTEQRFFSPSGPDQPDWDDLNIWQAATDHHRIVQALRSIYPQKWISTGASKGGMTSVYHRRFYPDDVAGTVAYVAPNDKNNDEDSAYDQFFTSVGADPACRQALRDIEREALVRREELGARFQTEATRQGWTFSLIGSLDRALEAAATNTGWAFWQYQSQTSCATVPARTVSTEDIYAFLDEVIGFVSYTDQGLDRYVPYYYQAATQLGWPTFQSPHLRDLIRYPELEGPNSVLPTELRLAKHDPWPMWDIDNWVRTRSSEMLFVYGQNDPYGAERFAPSSRDSFVYTAPGGSHRSNIALLNPADRDAATLTVQRWANSGASLVATAVDIDELPEPRPPLIP